jgi:hypothetical protein
MPIVGRQIAAWSRVLRQIARLRLNYKPSQPSTHAAPAQQMRLPNRPGPHDAKITSIKRLPAMRTPNLPTGCKICH